jgi:hypothetical protein
VLLFCGLLTTVFFILNRLFISGVMQCNC